MTPQKEFRAALEEFRAALEESEEALTKLRLLERCFGRLVRESYPEEVQTREPGI
jgi:hypothetical protein